MHNVGRILRKEMRASLTSPVIWVALTAFGLCNAYVFKVYYLNMWEMSRAGQTTLDAPFLLTRAYLGFVGNLLLFLVPLVTMGSFAEERRQGTHELLFTLPLTDAQIVMGKYAAGLALLLVFLVQALFLLAPLWLTSAPAFGPLLCGAFGLLLFIAAVLGLGLAVSATTDNQIVAASTSFIGVLVLFLFNQFSSGTTLGAEGVLAYLSPLHHLDDFLNGVLDLSHTVFFLSAAALGLYVGCAALGSVRERG